MKATELNMIEAEIKLKIAADTLQSASNGIKDRELFLEAMRILKKLYTQQANATCEFCTEADT